jgi:hypothetical protein
MRFGTKAMIGAVIGLVLAGCGGSGGGGGSKASKGIESAGVANSAIQNGVIGATSFGLSSMSGQVNKPSLKGFHKAGAKDLRSSVAGFYKGLAARRSKSLSPYLAQPCSISGSTDFTITETEIVLTASDCVEPSADYEGAEEYTDGTLTFTATATGFGLEMDHFTDRTTRVSDGLLLEELVANLTVTGSFGSSTELCGSDPVPTSFSIAMGGSLSEKTDDDADGVLDVNQEVEITGYSFDVTVSEIDSITCEPSVFSASESGKLDFTDHVDDNNSVNINISGSDPLMMTATTVSGGTNVTIDGTFSVKSSCFDGTLTIETTTVLFIPDVSDCPTSGVIDVTGDVTGTVTYTSTGGVQVDEGSDGSVDQTYDDCLEADACV